VLTRSPESSYCVRCVLTQCVSLACAIRVQRKRISTCCVNKHATGRAAVLQQPCQWLFASGNIFLYETRCDRQRSNSCDRTLAPALRASTHGCCTPHGAPSVDSGGCLCVLAVASVGGDVSSGSSSSSAWALGMCTLVCVLSVPLDAARASGPARKNRAKFR
jgi:hypothetical protein